MFDLLAGMGEYGVVLLDAPTTLSEQPMRLAGESPLQVRGVTTELCVGVADNVSHEGDVRARLKEALGGAKLSAVLHANDGKEYRWTCNSCQVSSTSSGVGRLSACMSWECNGGPAKGTEGEKGQQIANVRTYQAARNELAENGLKPLQSTARDRKNIFTALVEAVKTHSLGQISHALYEVGGEYRRNM